MKTNLKSFIEFHKAICNNDLVFMFGTGISAALTGERYSWYKRITDEGAFSIEAAMLLKVICWLSPCSMIMRSGRVICLRLPLEISVKRSSILHRQESRVEYSMSKEMQNTTLCKKCIKLCKSNFYRMELCVTQVEVRNTLNGFRGHSL